MGEYYGSWNREQLLRINRWIPVDIDLNAFYVDLYQDSRWLERLLVQFPQADADGDGRITAEEAVRWHGLRVPMLVPGAPLMAWLPQGVSHWKELVPARDGAMLGTQVYLPAGEGPFPTLVGRGIRKGGQLDGAHWYLAKGFACVSQDLVPEGEELVAGAHGARARASRDIASDTYELVEWVARQPWCSGQIALFGYSAGGMATLPVLALRPPSLKAIITHIASTDSQNVIWMKGGVSASRRYEPHQNAGWEPGTPPLPGRPGLVPPLRPGEAVHIFKTDLAGWYDLFLQGSINDWLAWKESGKAVLVIGAGSHGPHPRPSRVPPDYADADIFWPDVPQFNLLTGSVDESSIRSVIYYFLMGDLTDPLAPGNLWKVTDSWPLPHRAASYYLTEAMTLREQPCADEDSAVTYPYDPNNPVVRVDINWRSLIADGPVDQRPLKGREDIAWFYSEPLDEPVEVTGPVSAELYISADVPDTSVVARLLDVYPDGYEASIAVGVLMARYHQGFEHPQPLQSGNIYKLVIDMGSTAIMFARGHRIGLQIMNSEAGRYTVHPNSYEPVASYKGAPVAHMHLQTSARYPSRLILPVLAPGTSTDYDPAKHALCKKFGYWDK